jgi:hypothetical protein
MRFQFDKMNCVVYGILTDVHTWRFYRIDNNLLESVLRIYQVIT